MARHLASGADRIILTASVEPSYFKKNSLSFKRFLTQAFLGKI